MESTLRHLTTTLVAAAVSLLILYFGAIFTGETFDALFLVIYDLAFLIASFAFRRKAMFITASVSILLITLTLTISKASTVYWWIYLLAAGIILIMIASVYEHYKTKGESIKGKTKHFFQIVVVVINITKSSLKQGDFQLFVITLTFLTFFREE